MNEKDFDEVEYVSDSIGESIEKKFEKGDFKAITDQLEALAKKIGGGRYLSLDFQINLFDPEKDNPLRVLTLGISAPSNEKPFLGGGDSISQRYIVNGVIVKVPNDQCPDCWGEWSFKFDSPVCFDCGIELGKDVKVLLDTEICPHCNEGKVTPQNKICDSCGFDVLPEFAYWG